MSAVRPPDPDDARDDPSPGDFDEKWLADSVEDAGPTPPFSPADLTPDERVERTRESLIDAHPDSAAHWNSDEGDAFLRRMDAIENGPYISTFRLLLRGGAKLPSPESIPDEEIACALWALIGELAARRIFLHSTDHLSDRGLYEHLWFESLREGIPDFKPDPRSAWVIDILGSCSDDDLRIMHTYYSDDETRASWLRDFPTYEMPIRQPRPYDRDRFLPQAEDAWRELAAQEDADEGEIGDCIDEDSRDGGESK